MKLLRSLLVVFLFGFFGIGAIVINYLIFPIGGLFVKKEKKRQYYCDIIHSAWHFFTRVMEKTGTIKVELINSERIENIKSKIIVANHPSFIDIVILIGLIPNSICMAKKELRRNPFMGNIVKSLYLINDENTDNLLKDTTEILNQGFNIIIFPTGTRTIPDTEMKLHKGAAMMAIHTKSDVLPICIECDTLFLAKKQKIYEAGEKPVTYKITINEEIKTKDFSKGDFTKIQIRNRVNTAIKEKISRGFENWL